MTDRVKIAAGACALPGSVWGFDVAWKPSLPYAIKAVKCVDWIYPRTALHLDGNTQTESKCVQEGINLGIWGFWL